MSHPQDFWHCKNTVQTKQKHTQTYFFIACFLFLFFANTETTHLKKDEIKYKHIKNKKKNLINHVMNGVQHLEIPKM